jgi:hypothetical protein
MASQIELLFKGRADFSQARDEIRGLRNEYDKELRAIKGIFKDALLGIGADAGLTGKQMAQLTAGVTVAGAAVAAFAGITISVGVALFNLVKQTAATGSKIYDLSQQTGIGALALSGLAVAADQSGSNLEALAGPLGKYNKLIGDAANENKKAIAILAKYGLTAQQAEQDSTAALGKIFLQIHNLENSTQRVTAAQEVFGAKMGAKVVPVIEQMNGSLDGAIQKARELGVAFTDEAAARADEFGDKLDDLEKKLTGVGYVIGNELLPLALNAMDQISGKLGTNVEDFQTWALAVRGAVASVISSIVALAQTNVPQPTKTEDFLSAIFPPAGAGFALKRAGQYGEEFKKAWQAEMEALMADSPVTPSPKRTGDGDGSAGGGRGRKRGDTSQKELAERLKAQDDELKLTEAGLARQLQDEERAHKLRETSLQQFTTEAIRLENERWQATRATLAKELADVAAHDKDRETKLKELSARLVEEEAKSAKRIQDLHDARDQKEAESARQYREAIRKIYDESGQVQIARLKDQAEQRILLQSTAEREIGKLLLAEIDREIAARRMDLQDAKKDAEEKKKIAGELGLLEVKRAETQEETARRIAAARRDEARAAREFADELRRIHDQTILDLLDLERREVLINARRVLLKGGTQEELKRVERKAEEERHKQALEALKEKEKLHQKEATDYLAFLKAMAALRKAREQEEKEHNAKMKEIEGAGVLGPLLQEINDEQITLAQGAGIAIKGMFDSVTGALGDMTKEYILYGKTSGEVLRKAVVEQIAAIAELALVQGSYAFAQGVWDIFANPARAPSDFLSAGLWFALAGGATFAGRKLAGNHFQQGAGSAGAGASDTGSAQGTPPNNQQFNYGGTSFPSSAAAGDGSRGGLVAAINNLADAQRTQGQGQAMLAQELSKFQSVPAEHLVRKTMESSWNVQVAVADALWEAHKSGHRVIWDAYRTMAPYD